MKLNYQQLLPADFHPLSRVWIYQSNRLFTLSEAFQIEDLLKEFVANWKSHGIPVKGWANLFFGQFIILMADESATGVSGCSTDSSVRLIKDIEQHFKVNLFDRQLLAFLHKDKVELLPLSQFRFAIDNNHIQPETLYFNNTVQTKQDLESKWMIPVAESWLQGRMKV